MHLLLDTHALIWWLAADRRLPPRIVQLLGESGNDVFVSAVSGFEIATKLRQRKLEFPQDKIEKFEATVHDLGCLPLAVTLQHGVRAGLLAGDHADPFDRLLAAQSEIDGLVLVTRDTAFGLFGTATVW